jgi:hypothetical protein
MPAQVDSLWLHFDSNSGQTLKRQASAASFFGAAPTAEKR